MADYPYTVTNPSGEIVLQAAESCRYPRLVELTLLEAGYTVRLHGKKITKTETRKNRTNTNNQNRKDPIH